MSKKSDNTERYKNFSTAYNRAFRNVKGEARKEAMDAEWSAKWKKVGEQGKESFHQRIIQLQAKSQTSSLFGSFAKARSKPGTSSSSSVTSQPSEPETQSVTKHTTTEHKILSVPDDDHNESQGQSPNQSGTSDTTCSSDTISSKNTPAQDQLEEEIKNLYNQIDDLERFKDSGLATDENLKQLKKFRALIQEKRKKLKLKKDDAKRQREQRKRRSEAMLSFAAASEANAAKLRPFMREQPGRPCSEDTYPDLHQTIVQIASASAGADGKRRTDILEACHTLDDLRAALLKEGYNLSRTALYLRLVPRRSDSVEGKKHVRTVPVRIRRAKNNLRARHEDANFTFATKEYLKSIASFFGSDNVFVLSVDDKAKVPIGVTAAKYQSPLIMHMTYEIRLPDHDFVKATKHKLTPSVYAACEIRGASAKSNPDISYSGPTYICIRSGKHESSTAYTHGYDFNHVMEMPEFDTCLKDSQGNVKPIGMMFVDGGPDENPRFPKTIDVYVQHFMKYDLDALFVVTHAPGMSAYNYVERRMAPLSKELAGLVLPHETCGTHLNSRQQTIDVELEQRNFKAAGQILGEIWSKIELDGHPVVAEYVENKEIKSVKLDEMWMSYHIRTSQYFLQIVKCGNEDCCSAMRTKWISLFPERFLLGPIPLRREEGGPIIPDSSNVKASDRFISLWERKAASSIVSGTNLPYDSYCPSVKKDLVRRTCKHCNIYFTSMAAVTRHRKGNGCPSLLGMVDQRNEAEEETDTIEIDEENDLEENEGDAAPVFNLLEVLAENPFMELEIQVQGEDEDD